MHAVAGEAVERALVRCGSAGRGASWYSAQHRHDVLGLGGLGEGGEAAQVAEQMVTISRRWFSSIFSSPAETISLGELRRQEARSRPTRSISSTCSLTRCSEAVLFIVARPGRAAP